MVNKLYYEPGRESCEAIVRACRVGDGCYEILLDATVIYPEGGGQLSDTGYINTARVSHAFEEGHDIWHRTDAAFAPGETVIVLVDWAPRLDHTQQHTGEHILSGLAKTLFGAVNVGFHMAEDYATIDLDLPLTEEQLALLEAEANRAVQRDVPTEVRTVTAEELEEIGLRKRAKGLEGDDIRIVWCGGVDSCTCCGTHCTRSGEVGAIKITAHIRYKGGTRLWFACGMRAVAAARQNAELVDKLARRFSTKPEHALEAVLKQGDELASLKHALRERTDELFDYRAAALLSKAEEVKGVKAVVHAAEGLNAQELKLLAEKLCSREKAIAVLFAQNGDTLLYQLWRAKGVSLSMREVCDTVNAMTGGRGGGREDAAQGSAKLQAGFGEMLAQFERYIIQRMRG